MTSRECLTCCEEYDSGEHRIRILHCGHSQCTTCMEAQYSDGQITCAECRAIHRYPSFSNIPVCYIAEKIWEDMDKTKIQENLFDIKEISPQAPPLHNGICVEHGAFKLFWCNSHQKWICTHCSVIEHPRGDCEITTIQNKIENDKPLMKSNISKELMQLDDIKKEVSLSIDVVEKQTEDEKNQIKAMMEEIDKIKNSISQKEMDIFVHNVRKLKLDVLSRECIDKRSALENIIANIDNMETFEELEEENGKGALLISSYDNMKKELKEIREISQMLQLRIKKSKMYATKTMGNVLYFALIEQRQGSIFLNDLQPNVSPDSNAMILQFEDVMGLISNLPTAFVTLDHQGTTLGCLHIMLTGPPIRTKQFLELVTASSGRGGYRSSKFKDVLDKGKSGERVLCERYTNTSGHLVSNNLYEVERGTVGDPLVEGTVFGSNGVTCGFVICTKTKTNDFAVTRFAIGCVTSGLSKLRAALKNYDITDIVFSDCGVILDSHF